MAGPPLRRPLHEGDLPQWPLRHPGPSVSCWRTRPQLIPTSLQGLRGVFRKTYSSRLATIFATERRVSRISQVNRFRAVWRRPAGLRLPGCAVRSFCGVASTASRRGCLRAHRATFLPPRETAPSPPDASERASHGRVDGRARDAADRRRHRRRNRFHPGQGRQQHADQPRGGPRLLVAVCVGLLDTRFSEGLCPVCVLSRASVYSPLTEKFRLAGSSER
jgi:hypothetical protein